MCGIIAVLRRLTDRPVPSSHDVEERIAEAVSQTAASSPRTESLAAAADTLESVDRLLRGAPGIQCLLGDEDLPHRIRAALAPFDGWVATIEKELEEAAVSVDAADLEELNASLIRLRDALWAIRMDRLSAANRVRDLAGGVPETLAAMAGFASVDVALSALDRLEVRGRDSAGLSISVAGVDASDTTLQRLVADREHDVLYTNGAFRQRGSHIDLTYKYAAEIGELGDNVRALRTTMRDDAILQWALRAEGTKVSVLGHTRWASVGIISEPNAHPLNHEETERTDGPYVIAALNGDVDNHNSLREEHSLAVADEITTDAKVIPALVSRRLADGMDAIEAFRATVAQFEGSVAIGAQVADTPGTLMLALRGSGQALYVGTDESVFVVASEPYGVVEECSRYLRMDGETPGNPANPQASRGQIVVLSGTNAGTVEGIQRFAYDGTELPVAEGDLQDAPITTRDIDRGTFPHYLLKEVTEAPESMRKTLRGKLVMGETGQLHVHLGEDVVPTSVRQKLRDGRYRQIYSIGQGTAAVAGQGVAAALSHCLGASGIAITALPATELSGFQMREDMSDSLVIAISQSGTTTDTNRTVDLLRGRGAQVLAIVNRRGSDLTDKADGVLYTSDGRDVEMSVASTKAFYAQVAAGWLLALGLAEAAGVADPFATHQLLESLRALPDAMKVVLGRSEHIQQAAVDLCPKRRYWALVGNGPNRVAANEVRIKLSELCYKSIASDATEDKKHIDLSAEPLILVCAAGLSGSTADDVAKEVAIYRAHKAAPIAVCTEGEARFDGALHVITVPNTHPSMAFVLSTMAGHLFGYYAALAIDATAHPLRSARAALERAVSSWSDVDDILDGFSQELTPFMAEFLEGLQAGNYNGSMEASTAVRLAALLTAVTGRSSIEGFRMEVDSLGTPGQVLDDLNSALTLAIDELTRPIDAIKHQAKTVTVGISRADEALMTEPVIQALIEAGADRDCVATRDLRAMADLSPAIAEVLGATRYAIDGEDEDRVVRITNRTGVSRDLPSRTDQDPALRGTKHLVADQQEMMVARGRSDARTVILVPEVKDGVTRHLTLIHVRTVENLAEDALRGVLGSYRNRWNALRDAVLETESEFRADVLQQVSVVELLTDSIHGLAERWR